MLLPLKFSAVLKVYRSATTHSQTVSGLLKKLTTSGNHPGSLFTKPAESDRRPAISGK